MNAGSRLTDRILSSEDKITEVASEGKWRRPGLLDDIKALLSLLKDYCRGEYREVSKLTVAATIFACAYFLNPLDLIPDFIPFLGQLDDIVILAFCFWLVRRDLEKYKEWKRRSRPPPPQD